MKLPDDRAAAMPGACSWLVSLAWYTLVNDCVVQVDIAATINFANRRVLEAAVLDLHQRVSCNYASLYVRLFQLY